jgi:hypothetical protein
VINTIIAQIFQLARYWPYAGRILAGYWLFIGLVAFVFASSSSLGQQILDITG